MLDLSIIYPWGEPEYLLSNYSLEQLVFLREEGWKAKETEARVYWGVLGELLNGNKKTHDSVKINDGIIEGLSEFAKEHKIDTSGPWTLNR